MRICFIADSSSIHVQRIVAHFVRKKDDVLVLSSAPHMHNIPGTRTVHLLNTDRPYLGISSEGREAKKGLITYLKSRSPISLNRLIKDTINGLCLLQKRAYCVKEIQRFNPGVIYCFRSFPEGLLASKCHVKPLLMRTAGSDISRLPKYPVYRKIVRKALQAAVLVITESVWERELLRDLCGDALKTEVIITGVDTNLFRPTASRDRLRDKYGVPRAAFVVVSNRHIEGFYNGWMVVEAMQAILGQCRSIVLLYANPSIMRPPSKAKAEAIAARFPQIKFLEGHLPHSEVPDVLGCGDVYINFSSYDGIPNSLLEAMACGLVPIVADLPQLHEWIEHGITGYIVPQYDKKSLASVVSELYKNRQTLSDMSDRCVRKIREQGSYEVCMARTRDLMKHLAHADSGARTILSKCT